MLLFADSFDHYLDLGAKWPSTYGMDGSWIDRTGHAANGVGCLNISNGQGPSWTGNKTKLLVGSNFLSPAGPSNCPVLQISDVNGTWNFHLVVEIKPDGSIFAMKSWLYGVYNTVYGISAPGVYTFGEYNYIEAKFCCDASNGSIEIRVNGAVVLSSSGIDTVVSGATASCRFMQLCGRNSSFNSYHDDLYLLDWSTAPNTDYLYSPGFHVYALTPNADGSPLQWTPSTAGSHYSLIDAEPPNPGQYVGSDTAGQVDEYLYPAYSGSGQTVLAVQHVLSAALAAAGTSTIASCVGGLQGPAKAVTSTSDAMSMTPYDLDPVTGAAWTTDGLSARTFGPKLIVAGPAVQVDQSVVEVLGAIATTPPASKGRLTSIAAEALVTVPPPPLLARVTQIYSEALIGGMYSGSGTNVEEVLPEFPYVHLTQIASEVLIQNPAAPPLPPYPFPEFVPLRSYLTQELQNYFDDSDVRIRGFRSTLDAQLLNAAAVPMEAHALRMSREIAGRYPATCPLNLDNRGVYTRAQLPTGFVLSTDADGNLQLPPETAVYGTRGIEIIPLPVFDDTLPVPTRIDLDPDRQPVPLPSPVLWQSPEIVSANPVAPQVLVGSPLKASLGVLSLPNRLSIWVDNLGSYQGSVTVLIEGEPAPRILWPGRSVIKTEQIDTTVEGLIRTSTAWATVTSLLVYGLPAGATLTVYGVEIGLPQVPDPDRPYIDPRFRDVEFARYWQIDPDALNGDWVNELYYQNRDVGLGIAQSYRSGQGLTQLVVEPNTFGMFGFSPRNDSLNTPPTIYYFDRRELLPGSLASAALTQEPYFGLDVQFNLFQRAPRGVLLYPAPYSGAASTVQWRLLVEIPDGNGPLAYSQNGNSQWVLGTLNERLWQNGSLPKEIPFVLGAAGTYVFTLETRGEDGMVTTDSYPYANLELTGQPPAGIALPGFILEGIALDYRQRLWGWTGAMLLPLALHYDAFTFDAGSLSLYLTDPFDQVQIL